MAMRTSSKRKPVASGYSCKRRRKPRARTPRAMSRWQRWVLAVGIVFVFAAGFYTIFIRPYAYRWKPCHGQKGYGVCMPCRYEVHGVDVSHYQGVIDWKRVAADSLGDFPLRFAFLKATEGGDHGDSTFQRHFAEARKAGLVCGAYHYFIPATDARRQADFFIRTVPLRKGDLPPVLDVETLGKRSPRELRAAVKIWLNHVERHYGVKPILYTSYKFKMRYLNDSLLNTYPYWIAHYYVDSVRYRGRWDFWQHTDVGRVPGIEKEVDLNVFNGSLDELRALTLQR